VRKYHYRYVRKIVPITENTDRLEAGKLLHEGLEELYLHGSLSPLPEWQATTMEWLNSEHLDGVLQAYAAYYHDDDLERWKIIQYGDSMVEPELLVTLGGYEIILKPDLVVYDEVDGIIRVVDHKTTFGYIRKEMRMMAHMGHQLKMYILGLKELTGMEIGGAVMNAIYAGERALNPASKAVKFDRYVADYTPDELEATHRSLDMAHERMMDHQRTWQSVTHLDEANIGYHCSFCSYKPLCSAAPNMIDKRIASDYKQSER